MSFGETSRIEQAVRSIVDNGERYSKSEIASQVQEQFPRSEAHKISQAIDKVLAGAVYNMAGGKFGRNGS